MPRPEADMADDPKNKPAPSEPAGGPRSAHGPRSVRSDSAALTVPATDSEAGVYTVPAPPSWDSLRGELVVHDEDEPQVPVAAKGPRAKSADPERLVDTAVDEQDLDDDGETMALDSAALAVARATMEDALEEPDGDTEVHKRSALDDLADDLAAQHDGDTDVHDKSIARIEALAAAYDGDTDVRDIPLDGTTAVRDDQIEGATMVRDGVPHPAIQAAAEAARKQAEGNEAASKPIEGEEADTERRSRPPAASEAPAAAAAPSPQGAAMPAGGPPSSPPHRTPLPPPPARSARATPPPPAGRVVKVPPLQPPMGRGAVATPLPPPVQTPGPLPPVSTPARGVTPVPPAPTAASKAAARAAALPIDRNKATVPDLRKALEVARGSGAFDRPAAPARATPLPSPPTGRAADAPAPAGGGADKAKAMLPIPRMPAAPPLQVDTDGPPPLAIRVPLEQRGAAIPAPPSSRGADEDFWIRDTSERPKVMIRETAALPLVRLADGEGASGVSPSEGPPNWPPRDSVPRPPWAGAKAEAEIEALRAENRRLRAKVRTATAVAAVALLGAGVVALLYVQQSRRMPAVESAPLAPDQPIRPLTALRQGFEATSAESGVKVFIDGIERGTLPAAFDDLTPGPHRIRFERANGRGSSERVVEVEPGKITNLGSIELP